MRAVQFVPTVRVLPEACKLKRYCKVKRIKKKFSLVSTQDFRYIYYIFNSYAMTDWGQKTPMVVVTDRTYFDSQHQPHHSVSPTSMLTVAMSIKLFVSDNVNKAISTMKAHDLPDEIFNHFWCVCVCVNPSDS